jgi:hypothetical protein
VLRLRSGLRRGAAAVDHFQGEGLRPLFLFATGNQFLDNVEASSYIASQCMPAAFPGGWLRISPDYSQSVHFMTPALQDRLEKSTVLSAFVRSIA